MPEKPSTNFLATISNKFSSSAPVARDDEWTRASPDGAEGIFSRLPELLHFVGKSRLIMPIHWISDGKCSCGTVCPKPGKHPLTSNGLTAASKDPATIAAWDKQYPLCNWAVVMEPSGLLGLDRDDYNKDHQKLAALELQTGVKFPTTLTWKSGSGDGAALVFKDPGFPVRGLLGGIVVRSKAYVIIPVPDATHITGPGPQWIPGLGLGEVPIADLPDVYKQMLRRDVLNGAPGVPADEPAWLSRISPDARVEAARAHLAREQGETKGVSPASTTYNVARTVTKGFAIRDPQVAIDLMVQHYDTKCSPPWGAEGIARKVGKAYDAHLPDWGSNLRGLDERMADLGVSDAPVTKVSPREPHPGGTDFTSPSEVTPDPTTWEGQLMMALIDVQTALGIGGKRNNEPMFMSARDLMKTPTRATPWLVESLITEGGIAQMAGEPKVAKTWSLTEVALAVAVGDRAFGHFPTGTPKRVAYYYAEDTDRDVKAHLAALAKSRGIEMPEHLYVQPRGRFIDLLDDGDMATIIASVRKLGGVDLLCLDPLRDIQSGEEDKSDSMRNVMRRLRVLGEILSCTVGVVHHMVKAGGQGKSKRGGQKSRGSSAIHGSTDSGLYMTDLKGDGVQTFTVTVESEVKGARSAGTFGLTLNIKDDANGSAINAEWQVDRKVKPVIAAATPTADDDATVMAVVLKCATTKQYYTASGLRSICGIPDGRARLAIGRLIGIGRIKTAQSHPVSHKEPQGGGAWLIPG